MEFLRSFLRRHFAGKLLVASRNVVCFLKLEFLRTVTYSGIAMSNAIFINYYDDVDEGNNDDKDESADGVGSDFNNKKYC